MSKPALVNTRRYLIGLLMSIIDGVVGFVAMYLAITWRYDFENKPVPNDVDIKAGIVFAITTLVVWMILRIHRGVWRFTSLNDIRMLSQGVFLVAVITPLIMFLFFNRLMHVPRSVPIIAGALFFAVLTLIRLAVLLYYNGDIRAIFRRKDAKLPNALLIGSEVSANDYIRDVSRKSEAPSFNIQGIISTESHFKGRSIRGVPVLGDISEIEKICKGFNGSGAGLTLIAAQPNLQREFSEKLVRMAAKLSLPLVRVQPGGASELTPFEAADLIGRPVQAHDVTPVRRMIEGQTVLVTGAGGTIGSELTRQIFAFAPKKLVLLDLSEFNTYSILQELDPSGEHRAKNNLSAYLGDVRDLARLEDVFGNERTNIVLHAAALKHVPLGEMNPLETLSHNLIGTDNVLAVSEKFGASSFTLVSTDKAVRPTNIMGASKRLAEILTLTRQSQSDGLSASCVRFGNVLASTGSVIPLFESQIAKGGPVTVTHKDVERYFMTTQEAAALVLQSAAMNLTHQSREGAIYVLDMGEPVNIARLARQLIRLRGFVPDRDIDIEYTGLRPGEKLSEVLIGREEHLKKTKVKGVMRFTGLMVDPESIDRRLSKVMKHIKARNKDGIRKGLETIIPCYKPNGTLSND